MSGLRDREFNPNKGLHHFDRLRTLAQGHDVAPVTVEIDPVAYCNHACGWCVDPVHQKVQMTHQLYESLISELAEFTVEGFAVEGIVFKGGGEPTLHPDFGAMVKRAVDLGFSVGVVKLGILGAQYLFNQNLGQKNSYQLFYLSRCIRTENNGLRGLQ